MKQDGSSSYSLHKISDVDHGHLIEAFEGNGQDYLELAVNLGIKRSTSRSIVITYLETGRIDKLPWGGARHVKMNEEIVKFQLYYIIILLDLFVWKKEN